MHGADRITGDPSTPSKLGSGAFVVGNSDHAFGRQPAVVEQMAKPCCHGARLTRPGRGDDPGGARGVQGRRALIAGECFVRGGVGTVDVHDSPGFDFFARNDGVADWLNGAGGATVDPGRGPVAKQDVRGSGDGCLHKPFGLGPKPPFDCWCAHVVVVGEEKEAQPFERKQEVGIDRPDIAGSRL